MKRLEHLYLSAVSQEENFGPVQIGPLLCISQGQILALTSLSLLTFLDVYGRRGRTLEFLDGVLSLHQKASSGASDHSGFSTSNFLLCDQQSNLHLTLPGHPGFVEDKGKWQAHQDQ